MPLNEKGEEVLDSRPMEVPLGFQRPETLQETMRRLIRDEDIQGELRSQGIETFDESEDFDCGDEDNDPFLRDTPYELEFDPGLGKEIYKAEKVQLDRHRREFQENVNKEKKKRWFGFGRKSKDENERGRDSSRARDDDSRRQREDNESDSRRNDAPRSRGAPEEI